MGYHLFRGVTLSRFLTGWLAKRFGAKSNCSRSIVALAAGLPARGVSSSFSEYADFLRVVQANAGPLDSASRKASVAE